jgi:two-component system chemotaxis response regulator CheB
MDEKMSRSESTSDCATVLVVDDSVFMRRMVTDLIEGFPEFRVVGSAADGEAALRAIAEHDPDVVTLDIEMPRLDGFGVLERVMAERPRAFVVLSAYTGEGSGSALRALELGAVDVVAKPSGPVSFDVAKVEAQLYKSLQAARVADLGALLMERRGAPVGVPAVEKGAAVVIAASTGGPRALSYIFSALPPNLGAAVLVVQHMPAGFTSALAVRLAAIAQLPVAEATGGDIVTPNRAFVAPGDFHMRVRRVEGDIRISLDQKELVNGTRPAADALFPTAAEAYGERCIGVVLTGMGRDGAAGLAGIRAAGGRTLVQDESSSVVYGMPGRAVEVGAAERVLPLGDIPGAIIECLNSLTAPAEGKT